MRALLVTLLVARVARAGLCDSDGVRWMADEQEARAKQNKIGEPSTDYHLCLSDTLPDLQTEDPKLAKRLLTSCETILTKKIGDELCTNIAAVLHKDALGKTDIVDELAKRIEDPRVIWYLVATRSDRAVPVALAAWRRMQPPADAKPADLDVQNAWAVWREGACELFVERGGATEKAFLDDQLQHKIDRGVKKAAKAAVAQIEKRATPPAPSR